MPDWREEIAKRLLPLKLAPTREAEIVEELTQHLEDRYQEFLTRGMTEDEARLAALGELSDEDLLARGLKQVEREVKPELAAPGGGAGNSPLAGLWRDIRYGLQQLRRNPGFTIVAVATLALGIGANTAIFSVVYAVLLKPLPFRNSGQLVRVFEANKSEGITGEGCTYPEFQEWQRQNRVFSGIAEVAAHELTLTGRGEPMVVRVGDVTADFFSVLGVSPLMGRTFLPADDAQGAAPVVVISSGLWRSRFGADPGLIGNTIDLDKRSFTVIGVMPSTFWFSFLEEGPGRQVWIPIVQDPVFGSFARHPTVDVGTALARLKPGVSAAEALAEMQALGKRLMAQYHPGDKGRTIRIISLHEAVTGESVSAPLLVLLASVGLVLLIACANVANLLLARATSRAREFAIRAALGAGRARILRQLLTESAVLGLLGAAAGIALAYWGVRGLSGLLPPSFPRAEAIHVDGSVLAFALLLSLGASLLFGVAPALFAADPRLHKTLQESAGRQGEGRGRRRARNLLVVAEVSLAMLLLAGAGLLIRSFAVLLSVDPGFDPKNVMRAEVSLPQFQYSRPQQWTAFSNELLTRLQAQPGFEDSALGGPLPMDHQGEATFPFTIVGNPPLPPGKSTTADYATVSPEYFRVMRIPLLRGRFFSAQDSPSNPPVAIISETLARLYFPNQDPIGRQMRFGFPPNGNVSREIVGVVGGVRDTALSRRPGPEMYVPFAQAPLYGGEVVVRSSLGASTVAAGIRQAVHSIDKDLPVTDIEFMSEAVDASLGQTRLRTWLLGIFGAVALILAAAGIFGVISYSVSRRTHEFGIRIALGATRGDVLKLVVGQGFKLTLIGVALGIIGALGLTRFLSSLLYGLGPADPLTFIAVSVILAAVALFACYIPARRATKVDPVVALRYE